MVELRSSGPFSIATEGIGNVASVKSAYGGCERWDVRGVSRSQGFRGEGIDDVVDVV